MYHVKAIPRAPPGGLDLNIADEDEFSPDKLRANIERLYMTVIIGLLGLGKHIARLRSWREPRRTAAFCAIYSLAWLIGYLIPVSIIVLVVLIFVPKTRPMLFPPAPMALVNSKTGGIQKPKAGVLGSHDSATGAPEKHQGEAVEQEASNLVSGIASVAIASASGRHDQGDPEEAKGESTLPDPTKMAVAVADSKDSASGGQPVAKHDKTKQPMEDAIWTKMRPAMHVVGDIADAWERIANALSPTPPFPHTVQYQLAAVFGPLLLLSLFVKPAHVVHGTTFVTGLIFFSDPLLQRGIAILNEKIPDWPKFLQLRNTLLKGVPTNAQLTITLLRIGEANRAPLPPPPHSDVPPPDEPAAIDKHAITSGGLDASHSEIHDAITSDDPPSSSTTTTTTTADSSAPSNKKTGGISAKLMSVFKSTAAASVSTKLSTDHVRAAVGSGHAKQKLGILPHKEEMKKAATEGPIEFKGRFDGQKGAVYIDSSVSPATGNLPTCPCVYFTKQLDGNEEVGSGTKEPIWAVSINEISELKKVGGLGWKGKIIVGWATEREIKDSLEIVGRNGERWRVTALKERDELFNRLVAVGGQVWESY